MIILYFCISFSGDSLNHGCESAALSMAVNLENSEVTTQLEKMSFHSNIKERYFQGMFKLLHNCTHLTC